MATKILNDIHNDLKLLISAITGFEESDEGFRICERFVLSNVKHHRYLSVDGHATKRAIEDVAQKFAIHGKYKVAKKFNDLVNTFLTSFDFDHHPQYDLQWSLLSLLLNLSNETNKADLKNLNATGCEHSLSLTVAHESGIAEEIDWGEYLKEGQDEFFCDYHSSSESEWSEDETSSIANAEDGVKSSSDTAVVCLLPVKKAQHGLYELPLYLIEELESRNWLKDNIQNTWWTKFLWQSCKTDSQFRDAHFCELWNKSDLSDLKLCSTLSEYQASRELLWMFHVPDEMVVFKKNSESNFNVREQISIPSLTPNAFRSILSQYCEFYSMINEIEKFGKNLYRIHDSLETEKKPPLTYEEYNTAMGEHLAELKMGILEIEKKIVKQSDCHTFLTLSNDLKKCMTNIKILYEVHRTVVIDWKVFPNWKCTTKLLSNLYQEVQNSSSRERSNLCASLYLSSLKVYLNIIADWLSEGRLEDSREEFFITKTEENQCGSTISDQVDMVEDKPKGESFKIYDLDASCLIDPVINLLLRKVQHMGRNIELLVTLDRISDMWEMTGARKATRMSLIDEFLNEVTIEFSKYNFPDPMDSTDARMPVEQTELSRTGNGDDVNDATIQQMLKMDNPFLMKAFEQYLPIDLFAQTDGVDAREEEEDVKIGWARSIFRWLENISATAVLPFRKVLENALEKVLDQRYSCASKLVKDILVSEYKLETHLKLMRCVYMMERGHTMNQFYQLIFNEIETSATWNNPNTLTCILQEVLAQEWPDSSLRWSMTVEYIRTHQVLQAADRLTLNYAIDWPVNMVLNDDALDKYNAVFRFQLKLKWALWTLNHLRFRDLEGKDAKSMQDRIQHFHARRLESLRFWLMHAIGSIHAYLAGQVLQGFGLALEKVLSQADNLDTIITVHNEYLEKVYEHCLQTSEYEELMVTIHNLLGMCVNVRDRWKRGAAALLPWDLDLLESSYTKYHTYIALALHNAVQHKDADYYKLTPCIRTYMERAGSSPNLETIDEMIEDRVTNLSRDLLTEVAHQTFPPSGLPIPIPNLIQQGNNIWIDNGVEPQLPEYLSLNQYDQIFSYIRWYHYEEQFHALNRSPYDLSNELAEIMNESDDDELANNSAKASC